MSGKQNSERHNWLGTSATMQVDGQAVDKNPAVLPFVLLTLASLAGSAGALSSANGSLAFHVVSAVVAIVGSVASFRYRYYSTWIGLFCLLAVVASIAMRIGDSIGGKM